MIFSLLEVLPHRNIDFYTESHGVFFEVDCVERDTQSPKLRTFHLDGDADETGPPRWSAGGCGFFYCLVKYLMK